MKTYSATTEAELSEYCYPLSIAHPKYDDQQLRLCVPGILDDFVSARFADIYWTEADE